MVAYRSSKGLDGDVWVPGATGDLGGEIGLCLSAPLKALEQEPTGPDCSWLYSVYSRVNLNCKQDDELFPLADQ